MLHHIQNEFKFLICCGSKKLSDPITMIQRWQEKYKHWMNIIYEARFPAENVGKTLRITDMFKGFLGCQTSAEKTFHRSCFISSNQIDLALLAETLTKTHQRRSNLQCSILLCLYFVECGPSKLQVLLIIS